LYAIFSWICRKSNYGIVALMAVCRHFFELFFVIIVYEWNIQPRKRKMCDIFNDDYSHVLENIHQMIVSIYVCSRERTYWITIDFCGVSFTVYIILLSVIGNDGVTCFIYLFCVFLTKIIFDKFDTWKKAWEYVFLSIYYRFDILPAMYRVAMGCLYYFGF